MKRASTIFLKAVIILIGIVALAIIIRFPLTEGRAVNLDLFRIYTDPLILYGYVATIPFFVALYQIFKLLGHIEQNNVFSLSSAKALRTIRYCAITIAGFIVGGGVWIIIANDGKDDPAGAIAMGIIMIFLSIVIAIATSVFEKILSQPQNTMDIKSKNILTREDTTL